MKTEVVLIVMHHAGCNCLLKQAEEEELPFPTAALAQRYREAALESGCQVTVAKAEKEEQEGDR